MAERGYQIHICDDWLSIELPDWQSVIAAQCALSATGRWTEVVPGLTSIAIQFDPALVSPDEANKLAASQLTNLELLQTDLDSTVVIPVCYEKEYAPDCEYVADKLGLTPGDLPAWHMSRTHRVTMLGFMPGFAYLESDVSGPEIGRLASARQVVRAGSLGITGRQCCIYSFDSPGGWPIIGRTPLRLFDSAREQPNLLSAGLSVRFTSISGTEFESLSSETGE